MTLRKCLGMLMLVLCYAIKAQWTGAVPSSTSQQVYRTGPIGVGAGYTNSNNSILIGVGNGTADTKIAIYDNFSGTRYGLGYQSNQFRLHLGGQSSDKFVFLSDAIGSSTLMHINYNGNVGIGIPPDQRLHVASSTNTVFRISNTTSVTDATLSLDFMTRNSAGRNARIVAIDKDLNKADLVLYTNGTDNATESAERMRITSNGNVGIGVKLGSFDLSPAAQLHIVSPTQNNTLKLQSFVDVYSASNVGLDFLSYATTATGARNARIEAYGVSGTGGGNFFGGLAFYTKNTGLINTDAVTEKMRITHDGNVGIGTTTPESNLHVSASNPSIKIAHNAVTSGATSSLDFNTRTMSASLYNARIIAIDAGAGNSTAHLAFHTNGTSSGASSERMRIRDNGNVGIGTTGPEALLHVSSSNATTSLKVSSTAASSGVASVDFMTKNVASARNARIAAIDKTNNKADLAFYTNGTTSATDAAERMRITDAGNVGIATTPDANANLHVSSSSTLTKVKLGNSGVYSTLELDLNGTFSYGYATAPSCGSGWAYLGSTNPSHNRIYMREKLVFSASHDIATNCSGAGSLSGDFIFNGQTSTKSLLVSEPGTSQPTILPGDILNVLGNSTIQGELKVKGSASPLTISDFSSRSIINANKALALNPTGHVAIGYDPVSISSELYNNYKLSVKGKIICEEAKVQLSTAWPDYVFDEKYELASLDSVETYINENKHLPEVPSAAEVKENGVNVGEMNAILLKKVEELTLYMIEQKKEIEALKKKNAEIEAQIKK